MKRNKKGQFTSKGLKGNQNAKGHKPNRTSFKKGEHKSIKTEFKKGEMSKKQMGENNSNWKGGKVKERERIRNTIEFRLWRESVFARDNFTCQKCGDDIGGNLEAHYIKNFAQFIELQTSIKNGITFCEKCHRKFHKKYGRQNNNQEQLKDFLL